MRFCFYFGIKICIWNLIQLFWFYLFYLGFRLCVLSFHHSCDCFEYVTGKRNCCYLIEDFAACICFLKNKIMAEPEGNISIIHSIYIYPSESTHQVLSKVLLEGSNYHTWSREVKRCLGSKKEIMFHCW